MNDETFNENFERILLFKPQGEYTYIRKLSMSYGYYTALAVVDGYDRVTHIGANNNFKILPYKKLDKHFRRFLSPNKRKLLKDDDIMSIYKIESPLKLIHKYHLTKPCRGMRYTLPEETYMIKKIILHTLSDKHGISIHDVEKLGEYTNLYQRDVPLNFNNVLFNLDNNFKDMTIPSYDTMGAKGQTKLL
jgi:hypothetical protein